FPESRRIVWRPGSYARFLLDIRAVTVSCKGNFRNGVFRNGVFRNGVFRNGVFR
ncbi:MAG: hypothetical protein ACI9G1_002355, partial [Pirellulaceae bacterium]